MQIVARANFDILSSTVLNEGENIASVVKNSTGDVTLNFTTPLPSNYQVYPNANNDTATTRGGYVMGIKDRDPGTYKLTTSCTFQVCRSSSQSIDAALVDLNNLSVIFVVP